MILICFPIIFLKFPFFFSLFSLISSIFSNLLTSKFLLSFFPGSPPECTQLCSVVGLLQLSCPELTMSGMVLPIFVPQSPPPQTPVTNILLSNPSTCDHYMYHMIYTPVTHSLSSLWTIAGLSLVCPCLSYTEKIRTGLSTLDLASLVLRRGIISQHLLVTLLLVHHGLRVFKPALLSCKK